MDETCPIQFTFTQIKYILLLNVSFYTAENKLTKLMDFCIVAYKYNKNGTNLYIIPWICFSFPFLKITIWNIVINLYYSYIIRIISWKIGNKCTTALTINYGDVQKVNLLLQKVVLFLFVFHFFLTHKQHAYFLYNKMCKSPLLSNLTPIQSSIALGALFYSNYLLNWMKYS